MALQPEIVEIFTRFPHGRIALYLVRSERNALIDTGLMVTPERDVAPALAPLGLTLRDIDVVLNTHGHFDHTGGDHAVKSAGRAKILIHREEASMVSDRGRYLDDLFAPMVEGVFGKGYLEQDWGDFVQLAGPETAVDGFLEDNDVIDLGAGCRLRVLHLPGHTAGSLGFLWEKEGVLFSGDSLSGLHDAAGGLPIIVDLQAYRESVKRVRELPVRRLLMSHDYRGTSLPPLYKRQGEEVKLHLQDCLDVADRLSDAIGAMPPAAMDEPAIRVYDEVIARLPQGMGFRKLEESRVPALSAAVIFFTLRRLYRRDS